MNSSKFLKVKINSHPYHRKDLKLGTMHSILKQAGITKEELEENI